MRFENRIAIVTGSGKEGSIGGAIAERLHAEGATVVIANRHPELAEGMAKKLGTRAVPFTCDVSHSDEVDRMVEETVKRFGRLDILVNNVGFTTPGLVGELNDADWHRVVEGNLSSVFYGVRAALRPMRAQKSGAIVNIGSAAGSGGAPGLGAYGAAKAGVEAITKTAAVENYKAGVRVNCVLPNAATKPLLEWFAATEDGKRTKARIEAYARCGRPEEIASVVAFLASDDASYVNGVVVPVDGGLLARVGMIEADIQ